MQELLANDLNASDDLSYSLLTNPSLWSLNESTGVLSGTPTNDEEGLFAEQNFYVEVANIMAAGIRM
jgi:hypothetical protein